VLVSYSSVSFPCSLEETRLRGYVTSLTTGFISYALVGYYYYCFVAHICLAMGTRIKQRLTLLGGFLPLTKANSFINLGLYDPDAINMVNFYMLLCLYLGWSDSERCSLWFPEFTAQALSHYQIFNRNLTPQCTVSLDSVLNIETELYLMCPEITPLLWSLFYFMLVFQFICAILTPMIFMYGGGAWRLQR
jgi:hypothetical protein